MSEKKSRKSLRMVTSKRAPMPLRYKTKLRYCEGINLTGTSGAISQYVFRANGLYDPNYTGTGHQPKGFDQLMAIYDHATVTGARIHVIGTSSSGTEALVWGVNVSGSVSSSFTSYRDWIELSNGRYNMTAYNASVRTQELKLGVDIGKFLGVDDVLDDRALACSNAADASEDVAFCVWAQSQDTATTVTLDALVVIEYDVVFMEPRELAAS